MAIPSDKNDKQAYHTQPIIHNKEALPGGGGSPVARLNFLNSHVGVGN